MVRIKQDDSMFEIAEYLREEAERCKIVGPRYYEGWDVSVSSHEYRPISQDEGKWTLQARRRTRSASENDVEWLRQLAALVSKNKPLTYEVKGPVHLFTWEHEINLEEDDDEGRDKGEG